MLQMWAGVGGGGGVAGAYTRAVGGGRGRVRGLCVPEPPGPGLGTAPRAPGPAPRYSQTPFASLSIPHMPHPRPCPISPSALPPQGPIKKYPYEANAKKHIGMVAGGTGITPMLQVRVCVRVRVCVCVCVCVRKGGVLHVCVWGGGAVFTMPSKNLKQAHTHAHTQVIDAILANPADKTKASAGSWGGGGGGHWGRRWSWARC
mgnify:CR=1 FL=1